MSSSARKLQKYFCFFSVAFACLASLASIAVSGEEHSVALVPEDWSAWYSVKFMDSELIIDGRESIQYAFCQARQFEGDVKLSAKFMVEVDSTDDSGRVLAFGMALCSGTQKIYYAHFDRNQALLRQSFPDHSFQEFTRRTGLSRPTGVWHDGAIELKDGRLSVFLNGEKLCEAPVPEKGLTNGKIAFYATQGVAHIKDVRVVGATRKAETQNVSSFAVNVLPTNPAFHSVKIWDEARHSAFTDIVQFHGKFYCAFRESSVGHIPGKSTGEGDGVVRILRSSDGQTWESAALLKRDSFDLRDSKLSVTPDGRLMVVMGGSVYVNQKLVKRVGQVSFSDAEGKNFSAPQDVQIDPEIRSEFDWLWRVVWHDGVGYGVVYQLTEPDWSIWLIKTTDGIHYSKVAKLDVPGRPNETTVRFAPNGEMNLLIRRESMGREAFFAKARAPFTDWSFVNTGVSLGGPNFIYLPNGRILAGGRIHGQTGLGFIDENGKFDAFTVLPSAGDNSYPGFTIRDGVLFISYYSGHEGKTAIYLTKINLNDLK